MGENLASAKKSNLKQQIVNSRGAKKETVIIKVSKSGQHRKSSVADLGFSMILNASKGNLDRASINWRFRHVWFQIHFPQVVAHCQFLGRIIPRHSLGSSY